MYSGSPPCGLYRLSPLSRPGASAPESPQRQPRPAPQSLGSPGSPVLLPAAPFNGGFRRESSPDPFFSAAHQVTPLSCANCQGIMSSASCSIHSPHVRAGHALCLPALLCAHRRLADSGASHTWSANIGLDAATGFAKCCVSAQFMLHTPSLDAMPSIVAPDGFPDAAAMPAASSQSFASSICTDGADTTYHSPLSIDMRLLWRATLTAVWVAQQAACHTQEEVLFGVSSRNID